jgi:hypothetical protein
MSPQEINDLRLEVKAKLAGMDMDRWGKKEELARKLSEKTGRFIRYQSLVMALSGYRATEAYHHILIDLKAMLEGMSVNSCENIHVNQEMQ